MDDRGLKKDCGESLIEIDGRIYIFVVEDCVYLEIDVIYVEFEMFIKEMKEVGYMLDMRFVLYDVDDVQKEKVLCYYSEKLVIVYGLFKIFFGIFICIMKNFCVCGDCYIVIKFIFKIRKWEIVVRDVNWFYYFNNGICFCGDFW